MKQLIALKESYEQRGFHQQRLYCRRKPDNTGRLRSTFGQIMEPVTWQF